MSLCSFTARCGAAARTISAWRARSLSRRGASAGSIYRVDWYPGLVLEETGDVVGEIYQMEPALLAELDLFEGLPVGEIKGVEYGRVRTEASSADGRKFHAWVWEWLGPIDPAKKVTGGDWLEMADRRIRCSQSRAPPVVSWFPMEILF